MGSPRNAVWHAHLRLTLLRLLAEAPGYRANSSLLTSAADATAGFAVSRDQVRTELAWLAEQGLAELDGHIPGLSVATLTERGQDVATGRASVPGVQRPGA
jgi:hypothetical protein